MAMFKPSQSYSGGVTVDPYTGNIAQEMQFLSGEDRKKKTNPILRLGCPWQPSNYRKINLSFQEKLSLINSPCYFMKF